MATETRRVLIVDDSPEDRFYSKRLLARVPNREWRFAEASKGQEGLALASEDAFDCILLDYRLPDMDGIEFLERLMYRVGEPGRATVVLTGTGNESLAVRAIKSGAQDYLSKGALSEVGLLAHTVESAIDRFRLMEERAQSRRLIERANEELRRANDGLQFFADAASHDLQSPINNIAVLVELLARKYRGLDPGGDQIMEIIGASAQRMRELIHALVAYMQAGTADAVPAITPLSDAVSAVVHDLGSIVADSGAVVLFGALPAINMPETHSRQVLQNLIENAIKYRREGDIPRIEITTQREGSTWVIAVRDNGMGFEPEYAEKIFHPFKRLHGNNQSGSGIGLATCRRIVERYGGWIWAESLPGQGSTFYFTATGASEIDEQRRSLES